MNVTGTQFAYYWICHRKLWLFAHGVNMEHTSDLVYEGKLIHDHSYRQRAERYTEIAIDGVKIDFYDPIKRIVHETKKSDSMDDAHRWQLKFYIWKMEQQGIDGVTGLLEYPALRQTESVELLPPDRAVLEHTLGRIEQIVEDDACPARIERSRCKNCSYFDFCWSGE